MAAVAKNPAFAKKVGIKQSIGEEFLQADKGKKFKGGGMAKSDNKEDMKMDVAQDKKIIKKAFKMHDKQEHKGEHTNLDALKKGGKIKKYAAGGSIEKNKAGKSTPSFKEMGGMGMKKGGKVKMCGGGMSKAKKYAAGGSIDGIAVRGKTRAKKVI